MITDFQLEFFDDSEDQQLFAQKSQKIDLKKNTQQKQENSLWTQSQKIDSQVLKKMQEYYRVFQKFQLAEYELQESRLLKEDMLQESIALQQQYNQKLFQIKTSQQEIHKLTHQQFVLDQIISEKMKEKSNSYEQLQSLKEQQSKIYQKFKKNIKKGETKSQNLSFRQVILPVKLVCSKNEIAQLQEQYERVRFQEKNTTKKLKQVNCQYQRIISLIKKSQQQKESQIVTRKFSQAKKDKQTSRKNSLNKQNFQKNVKTSQSQYLSSPKIKQKKKKTIINSIASKLVLKKQRSKIL